MPYFFVMHMPYYTYALLLGPELLGSYHSSYLGAVRKAVLQPVIY